jgi:branched-chain amino acid transport system substrate-binding protein
MKRLAIAFGAIALSSSLMANGQSKGIIKIVSQTPLSGGQAVLGIAIKNGVDLAVQDYGKLVTAYGFRFVFDGFDDQAKAEVGVANANRLINDADVLGVIGHLNSGVTIPSSEVYAKVNLAMVTPAATNPTITDRRSTAAVTNRVCGRDDVQGPAGAEFAIKTLKAKRFYVISDKTAYGDGIAAAFSARAKELGAQILVESGFESSEREFSSVLNRAAIDKPDAIYFGAIYDQAGPFIKQARGKGITAAMLGGDGWDSSDLQKLAGVENLKNVYFTTTSAPISALPAAKRFAERYKAKFNRNPEGYSAYGYDAARAVIQAIGDSLKAGKGAKPTRANVAKALRSVKFAGVTGPVAFNARGDLPVAKYVVIQPQTEYTQNKVTQIISVASPTPDQK